MRTSGFILIAISIGIFLVGLLLTIYYGVLFFFLFLPIGFIWNAFRGNSRTQGTVRSGQQLLCANCGTASSEGNLFCPTCGQPLHENVRDSDLR